MHIIFKGYEITQQGKGLALNFDIDGIEYRRLSAMQNISEYCHKGQLLFWKRNNEEYLTEDETLEMEDMAETYFKTHKQPVINQLT